MNVTYRIEGLEFEWDEDKAESNFQKATLKSMAFALKRLLKLFYQIGDASRQGEESSFILGYSLTPDTA